MKTLYEEIQRHGGKSAPCLVKHLKAAGIAEWDELTRANLFALRDELRESVSPNSAKFYLAAIRAIIARFEDEIELPKDWRAAFRAKSEKPVKTFLSPKEIDSFAKVTPRNERERYVQAAFLCGCWTGARVSDIMEFTELNIRDGMLTYVAKKTGIQSIIPVKPGLENYIAIVQRYNGEVCLMTYNRIVRDLARRAGINKEVKIHKAGKTRVIKKWEALSSHSARISAASNLAMLGVPMADIKNILGHTSIAMSERYVVPTEVKLSPAAMKYFS